MGALAAQMYLSVMGLDPNGVFARVAVVAIGAGQMHNTFARRDGGPLIPPPDPLGGQIEPNGAGGRHTSLGQETPSLGDK